MKFAMMTKLSLLALVISLSSVLWAADAPAGGAIDPQRSSITVRVFKAGVFSAFGHEHPHRDRKSTRLNSSHLGISYAVFCLKKKHLSFHNSSGPVACIFRCGDLTA